MAVMRTCKCGCDEQFMPSRRDQKFKDAQHGNRAWRARRKTQRGVSAASKGSRDPLQAVASDPAETREPLPVSARGFTETRDPLPALPETPLQAIAPVEVPPPAEPSGPPEPNRPVLPNPQDLPFAYAMDVCQLVLDRIRRAQQQAAGQPE